MMLHHCDIKLNNHVDLLSISIIATGDDCVGVVAVVLALLVVVVHLNVVVALVAVVVAVVATVVHHSHRSVVVGHVVVLHPLVLHHAEFSWCLHLLGFWLAYRFLGAEVSHLESLDVLWSDRPAGLVTRSCHALEAVIG